MKPLLNESEFKDSYKLKKFADSSIERFSIEFPIYPNINLAKIAAFLTFDGHLREDCKGFLFESGKKSSLYWIRDVVKDQFGIVGYFRRVPLNYGRSYEYVILNSRFHEFCF
jgi:hypothetical protein